MKAYAVTGPDGIILSTIGETDEGLDEVVADADELEGPGHSIVSVNIATECRWSLVILDDKEWFQGCKDLHLYRTTFCPDCGGVVVEGAG